MDDILYLGKRSEYYYVYKNIPNSKCIIMIASCSFETFCNGRCDTIYISRLLVDTNYRNRGIGTKLLYEVLFDAYTHDSLKHAILTDISDMYRRSNNIYTKMGFSYKREDHNYHAMVGNLRHILFGKRSRMNAYTQYNIFTNEREQINVNK